VFFFHRDVSAGSPPCLQCHEEPCRPCGCDELTEAERSLHPCSHIILQLLAQKQGRMCVERSANTNSVHRYGKPPSKLTAALWPGVSLFVGCHRHGSSLTAPLPGAGARPVKMHTWKHGSSLHPMQATEGRGRKLYITCGEWPGRPYQHELYSVNLEAGQRIHVRNRVTTHYNSCSHGGTIVCWGTIVAYSAGVGHEDKE
jgi:hypothetical protein